MVQGRRLSGYQVLIWGGSGEFTEKRDFFVDFAWVTRWRFGLVPGSVRI